MLPDLSPTHILIVLVVALIVVGPKDLPVLLRKVGKFVGKMRGMANEFRASFDEMARQSELDDLRKEVEAMRQASQVALPKDLGIAAQMQSDAEAAYLANWEASHAPSTDGAVEAQPVMRVLPEEPAAPAEPAPAEPKAAKSRSPAPRTVSAKPASPKTAAKKPAKTETMAEATPKPRVRKTKPEADA